MGTLKCSSDPLLGFPQDPHFTQFPPSEERAIRESAIKNHEKHIVYKEMVLRLEQ